MTQNQKSVKYIWRWWEKKAVGWVCSNVYVQFLNFRFIIHHNLYAHINMKTVDLYIFHHNWISWQGLITIVLCWRCAVCGYSRRKKKKKNFKKVLQSDLGPNFWKMSTIFFIIFLVNSVNVLTVKKKIKGFLIICWFFFRFGLCVAKPVSADS